MNTLLKRVVTLLLVQSNCFDTCSAAVQYTTVVRFSENDNLYFNTDHIVDVLNTGNAKRCTSVCGQHANCMSFFYNTATNTCRLHQSAYFLSSDGTMAPNWRFYALDNKECPAHLGFIQYQAGFCLHVAKVRYKFTEGQNYCSQRNGRIISLETTQKRTSFSDLIETAIEMSLATNFLLGLHKTNGVWLWESGANVGDSNWGIGQPFCPQGFVCECAYIVVQWAGHTWNDDTCAGKGTLVCEYVGT